MNPRRYLTVAIVSAHVPLIHHDLHSGGKRALGALRDFPRLCAVWPLLTCAGEQFSALLQSR